MATQNAEEIKSKEVKEDETEAAVKNITEEIAKLTIDDTDETNLSTFTEKDLAVLDKLITYL